jgi:hypothetical protein
MSGAIDGGCANGQFLRGHRDPNLHSFSGRSTLKEQALHPHTWREERRGVSVRDSIDGTGDACGTRGDATIGSPPESPMSM